MAYRKKHFERPEIKCDEGRKAVIFWNNRKIYLGAWNGIGTPGPEVLQKYLRTLVEIEQEFHAAQLGIEALPVDEELTVSAAVLAGIGDVARRFDHACLAQVNEALAGHIANLASGADNRTSAEVVVAQDEVDRPRRQLRQRLHCGTQDVAFSDVAGDD